MKSDCSLSQKQPNRIPNVFSGMFSLLHEREEFVQGTECFKLPNIFQETHADLLANIPSLPSIVLPDNQRPTKINTACPHKNRKHYAKNMCNNCYHRLGRVKAAWACPHIDRKHYAKGKCQFCYIQNYHRDRVLREENQFKLEDFKYE
ncbi:unnamed protein product [Blepharisma stoltei]|uniref:Uncharacterized protein n=1 Tax=Blepharisma stoltei TaxID=1481888 RepID=A0AAU9J8P9_9CILI|nr:unnamed protein product [Blepharisma stoltei]